MTTYTNRKVRPSGRPFLEDPYGDLLPDPEHEEPPDAWVLRNEFEWEGVPCPGYLTTTTYWV